jgi:hypothetical protein
MRKNLVKFVDVGNPIWNTFHYCNFYQISTDSKLIKRFWVKVGLTDLCTNRLIATRFPNWPVLHFGQGVLHDDLQSLHYQPFDTYKLSSKIQEVIEFQRWLVVKLILEKSVWKLVCITLFGPFKQILIDLNNFCIFAHLYNKSSGTISLLGVWSNSIPINSQNLLTQPISPHYRDFEFKSWFWNPWNS